MLIGLQIRRDLLSAAYIDANLLKLGEIAFAAEYIHLKTRSGAHQQCLRVGLRHQTQGLFIGPRQNALEIPTQIGIRQR